MATISNKYTAFYLTAREERLLRADIDIAALAKQVIDAGPESLHKILRDAATNAAKPLEVDKKKRAWVADHEDEIAEAGGDSSEAYRMHILGRVDDLVQSLENDVVQEMADMVLGEEDDDEDDEDEDEEDDDEDDDEDEADD